MLYRWTYPFKVLSFRLFKVTRFRYKLFFILNCARTRQVQSRDSLREGIAAVRPKHGPDADVPPTDDIHDEIGHL